MHDTMIKALRSETPDKSSQIEQELELAEQLHRKEMDELEQTCARKVAASAREVEEAQRRVEEKDAQIKEMSIRVDKAERDYKSFLKDHEEQRRE